MRSVNPWLLDCGIFYLHCPGSIKAFTGRTMRKDHGEMLFVYHEDNHFIEVRSAIASGIKFYKKEPEIDKNGQVK